MPPLGETKAVGLWREKAGRRRTDKLHCVFGQLEFMLCHVIIQFDSKNNLVNTYMCPCDN